MDKNLIKQNLYHIALTGLFSILVMASSFYYGVTSGNDLSQHFQFANTIHHSIITGEFYPSWGDSINQGYGDAAIRFYPPFSYYIMSVSFMLVGDWYGASLLTFFLIFWAGGIGAYFWAKEEFSDKQSLLAAGLYIFAPYHVNQIYNNFLYAEFAATAVIPFCFLFVTRVCRRGKIGDLLGLSVTFALLILTHLPLTIISSLILFLYGLSLLKKDSFFVTLTKLAGSVAFAFLASSFYWVRMVTELSWIKHSSEAYFSSIFDYRQNFLFAPQNIINFQTDTSVLWFADLMLLATLLISIPSVILFIKNRRSLSRFQISIAFIFIISFLMTTPLSKPIWDNLAFLQKVQFPWRWLGIVSVSGAVFSSVGILHFAEKMNANKNHLLSIGLGLILTFYVFTSAFVIKQAVYLPREKFQTQITGMKSGKSFDCWWTIWMNSDALKVKDKLLIQNRNAEIVSWNPTVKEFKVSAGEAPSLRVATFYYPHWKATVNNRNVKIEKSEDSSISVPLPQESSSVRLYFQEPYFVRIANFSALAIWLIFFIMGGILFYKKFRAVKITDASLQII